MSWASDFPRRNHRVTSPASAICNCAAWAAEDVERWWQPGRYWLPADWPEDDFGLGTLEQAFRALGYETCGMDVNLESGFVNVALYGFGLFYTYAARQLTNGNGRASWEGEKISNTTPPTTLREACTGR